MKNLINNSKVSGMPKKESMKLGDDKWHYSGSVYHAVDGVWPHERVNFLCEKNIGKPFDYVFSKYCSQVPTYQQHFFLEELNSISRYAWGNTYYVDDNGNIQKTKRKKVDKSVHFYSDDYKVGKVHKVSGAPYSHDFCMKTDLNDYKEIIIEGYKLKFSSKNDPEFKRLSTDQNKRKRAAHRKQLLVEEQENIERLRF